MIERVEVVSDTNSELFERKVEVTLKNIQESGLVPAIQFTTVTDEDAKIVIHTAYITGREKY
jgi:azurin